MIDSIHSSNKYWENLIREIEPMLQSGEGLVKKAMPLIQKYHIELETPKAYEEMPPAFQEELQAAILSIADGMPEVSPLVSLTGETGVFQTVFEKLDDLHQGMERSDISGRSFIQQLMQEVMTTSVVTSAMELTDWNQFVERRKEACRIMDAAEHIYKKVASEIGSQEKLCVYEFFYNKLSQEQIDLLLLEAKESLSLSAVCRGLTKKRGQGMTRSIIGFIQRWQDTGVMKPMKSVYPFCQCLQQSWNNEINLGSRQGLEATYKQRM
ncbi:hypothetical protein [Bacteroides sp.]|uniref:hypothetical protein n=1 Tax=Bacteroides sp. TaxID=29523 RepID=UPI00261A9BD8|nr:hypothetical protein [Bacteroides sp.]MDD3038064.1 hypothetical protein [Bacteroides sp.]